MVIDSGLFVGTLRHRRFTPVAHAFTYPLFMALLDIDRVPELMRVSRLTSHNRWNWASFDDRDHLGDPAPPAAGNGSSSTRRATGSSCRTGRIFLLTHLRYLGYCFNPVSFFYCFDRAERLQIVLAEVSNTFGGTHNYWLRPDSASRTFRAAATKSLYVSPFMPVDLEYTFAFTPPAGRLVAHMETSQGGRGRLRRDAVARTPALERGGDPARARPPSRDDRERHGGDSLAGAEVVVEGRAGRASPHGDGVGERAAHAAETAGRTDSVMER